MTHASLDSLLAHAGDLRPGPVALVFAEDRIEVESTLRHHLDMGFGAVVAFGQDLGPLPEQVVAVTFDVHAPGAVTDAVSTLAARLPGVWLYWCYNAEYLFHPYSATRPVSEMLAFHAEERREAMQAMVLDLYPGDIAASELGVARSDAWFDGAGYYAEEAPVAAPEGEETLVSIRGGLRWRFDDFVPWAGQRLDRTAIFRARKGLRLREDNRLSDPALNTAACPWHRNLTAVIASFRAAKALRINPAPRAAIDDFRAPHSVRFEWSDRQLMELGFMEPGQWV